MKSIRQTLALAAFALFALPALSQTVTLTPSVTTGVGSINTTLTWSTTPAASSCTASGHTSWTGTKAASGTQVIPSITLSGSYTLALACTWPGDSTATITWVAPTTNTDGTALAKCATATTAGPCLAKFQVYHGATAADVGSDGMAVIANPTATSYVWNGLTAGTHCFAVEAVNGDGVAGTLSAVTNPCKTTTGTQTVNRSVTITVNPKPGQTTGVGVQ